MPNKLIVSLRQVQDSLSGGIVLDYPQRCSRCDAVPAAHYESHKLRLRIGRKRPGLYRQTYEVNEPYRLKIRVCQSCYRADFTTNIEVLENDDTPEGRFARNCRWAYRVGGVVAGAGMLLMTNFIHPDSNFGWLKANWPFVVGAGGIIIITTWLLQRQRMSRVQDELVDAGINLEQRQRAEVRSAVLENTNDPESGVLEIGLHNDNWAAECAAHYNYTLEDYLPHQRTGDE